MNLDSIYSMLATPVRLISNRKRIVDRVDVTSEIAADSHEAPQSQLPPTRGKHNSIAENKVDPIREDEPHEYITDDEAPLKELKVPIKHIDVEA
ncbi:MULTISPECIES: hypothetical protein [Pseudomonadati]|uniref:Uncharacterized protein n=1 Tax=Shewanella aestuarii TaxID=1028752 RepID=A0ABT0L2Y0_9GAMM|nr:hypothetical protein [Shewanella aestuarii]MCL1118064.1 hypothetical protein [Shewanella aestuarii]GGN79691.1 hypothetical protein GCM10009193_23950 [Shewanella aestuarii]